MPDAVAIRVKIGVDQLIYDVLPADLQNFCFQHNVSQALAAFYMVVWRSVTESRCVFCARADPMPPS